MKQNRRDFLKTSGLTGLGLAAAGISEAHTNVDMNNSYGRDKKSYEQKFNMSGFGAPKLDTVRIGFVGLGNRGPDAVNRMNKIDG